MIIVTGGAGFIGSALIYELNKKNENEIIIVDRLRDQDKWKNLLGLTFENFIYADDFFNPVNLAKIKGRVKAIYHMGACSSTVERNADYLMSNNFEFSKNIFKLAIEEDAKLIYASSAATYGDGAFGYSDDHELIKKYRPLNPYGYSKQLFDIWVLSQKKFPPQWYGLKFFNVYGPQEYHKGGMRSVVYNAFHEAVEKGAIRLFKSYNEKFKDGEQKRDFIYVKDVAAIMTRLMGLPRGTKSSGIYNIGTGKSRTFNDLARSVFKALKIEENIEYVEMPKHLRHQYQYFTQANMERLTRIVPDFQFRELEEGVADYVHHYLNRENPYF